MFDKENYLNATNSPKISNSIEWHWGWAATLGIVVLVTVAFRYALPVRDGDFWFHLLYGEYFLTHKTIIADHTIFSWTPTSNDTIYCTWLPDIFLYLLYQATGLPGVFAFRYCCMLVPVLGCFHFGRILGISTNPMTWFFCLLAVIMSYAAAFEKPEVLSFVFMTFLVWNWWHIRSSREEAWKNCYFFPVIMIVWVNTHGGFVFGSVFLVLILIGEILNTWLSPKNILAPVVRKHLTISLFLVALTPLLNPYGYHYPLQLFFDLQPTESNLNYNSKIAAYDSPFVGADTYLLSRGVNIAIALLIYYYIRNFKNIEWSSLLTNLVFIFLYTVYLRTTFYWVPIFLFSGLHLLYGVKSNSIIFRDKKILEQIYPVLVALFGFLIAGVSLYNSYYRSEKYLWMGFGIGDNNPVYEAQYIKDHFPNARIGNTYDQGAYLLWKLWPDNTVFFDARHFPYRDWSEEFFLFQRGGRKQIIEITKKYPCDVWLVGLQYPTLALGLLLTDEWKLAFYSRNSAVIVKKDSQLPKDVERVNLQNLKNVYTSLDLLRFATDINDFETAERLLEIIKMDFAKSAPKLSILWSDYYVHGIKAYQQKDYAVAAGKLGLITDPPDYLRYIITNCYQFLTQKAWEQKDLSSAEKFAKRSLELVPDNPFSLYNVGVIGWQRGKTNEAYHPQTKINEGSTGWRSSLERFLTLSKDDTYFENYRKNATDLLNNQQSTLPRLLLPSEPKNKKMF